jgi:hypothetical protein
MSSIKRRFMARFKPGDRVQLISDIARFYQHVIGVVLERSTDERSVLVQYPVRLADATVATFYDFQLQMPPIVRAHAVFDSFDSKEHAGVRDPTEDRQICLAGAGIEIDLKMIAGFDKSILGHVRVGNTPLAAALITLVVEDLPIATVPTDADGHFEFREVPGGEIMFETFLPGKRVVGWLTL